VSAAAVELALRNLLAWSLQVGVLALAAAAVGRVLPVERPGARLAFGQALLALVLLLPLVQPWDVATAAVDATLGAAPAVAGEAATAGGAGRGAAVPPASAIALLLALGAAFHLARVTVRLLRLARIGRSARRFVPAPWLAALRDAVAPRAAFAVSEGAGAAATYGYRRPLVLLPAAFAALPRERQQAVALHELLHARRGDWLFLVAEEALVAVLFFHPAVHWLVGRVRLAREQCVDAGVVRRLGARHAYLASLVAAARAASRDRAVPAAPFLRHGHLRERVDLLLKEAFMSRSRTAAHVAAASLAVLAAVALTASAMPLQATAKAAPQGSISVADSVEAPSEPKLVHRVNPVYPADAKAEKVQGIYVLDVLIGKDGAIREASVAGSAPTTERLKELGWDRDRKGTPGTLEGDPRLGQAAVDAVKQWRYEPILKNGKPVDFRATVTVNFKLQ
jgi:beta-lactamase regulating signal transducer with metallopeptidase domain